MISEPHIRLYCGRYNDLHKLKIMENELLSEKSVELLGINIDYKINFNKHISKHCKKAAGQLNAICRIGNYIDVEEKTVLINSFVNTNFNYCPLVWFFCSPESLRKIERIQERALRIISNDFVSDYCSLLTSSDKSTFLIKQHRNLANEIFKTLNNLNPAYMKDIFVRNNRSENSRRPNDLSKPSVQGCTYGSNSLRSLGPNIWNSLPEDFKSAQSLKIFKKLISTWDGESCSCKLCRMCGNS